MKILIIDDDRVLLELLTEQLTHEGFAICVAYDGLEGIECMITEAPDMVVLDIMMPGIDGYEVCKKLKESPATGSMPVVFLSARSSDADIDKAYKLGADDFIVKPFDLMSVGKRLRTVYQKTHTQTKRDDETV